MTSHFNNVILSKIDDAYVGELALKSSVDVFHDVRFRMSTPKCIYSNTSIVQYPVKGSLSMLYLFTRQIMNNLT